MKITRNSRSFINARRFATLLLTIAPLSVIGCTSRPPFLVNSDPSLRRTPAQFAADAAQRHFESEAISSTSNDGRAEVDYGLRRIHLLNTSKADWTNVELWLNQKYVVNLTTVPGNSSTAEFIPFEDFYDHDGKNFNGDAQANPVGTIHMYMDGKMYSVAYALD